MDGIRLLDESTAGLLPSMMQAYRRQGFDEGYRKAVRDLLDSGVCITEQFIARNPQSAGNVRAIVYAFHEHLVDSIHQLGAEDAYVCEGLGI